MANAAGIAGTPSRRSSSGTESPGDADASGSKKELLLALVQYPANIRQESIRFSVPVGTHGAGLEVRRVAYGTFTSYDEHGLEVGDYSASDILMQAHVDFARGELLTVRLAGGYISSHLSDATAQAMLWSVRAQLALFPWDARIGAALQNNGRFIETYGSDGKDKLPATWLVGMSKSLAHLPLTLYLSIGENQITSRSIWRLGGEFRISELLALRWGVDQGKSDYQRGNAYADLLTGFSLGCGFQQNMAATTGIGNSRRSSLRADVGVKLMGPLGISSSFAVGLEF